MSDFIDTEEVVSLCARVATSIQNDFLRNNWTGDSITAEQRRALEQMFLAFLYAGPGRFAFRKEVLLGIGQYCTATLERHQLAKVGMTAGDRFGELCGQTYSRLSVENLSKILNNRTQEMEDLHETLLLLPGSEDKIADNGQTMELIDKKPQAKKRP